MGIPSYFSHIIKSHNIINKLSSYSNSCHNLYLDSNSIIYDCVRSHDIDNNSISFNIIINAIISKIENYIIKIKPTKKVIIAFDGVAPIAKLDQQKQRRYKSQYQKEILKEIQKEKYVDSWNTLAITPGTEFMNTLNKEIYSYFNKKNNHIQYIVSCSDQVGEGEHKIYQYIRENIEHKNEKTIIYGLDADLIMLSLNHLQYCKEIFLYRETPEFIKSINSELEPNEDYLLDINELGNELFLDFIDSTDSSLVNNNNLKMCKLSDYIFLCFLLGNDFMPHFPAINIRTGGIDKLVSAYKHCIPSNEYITDSISINWNLLRKIIEFLTTMEEIYLKDEIKKRNKFKIYNMKSSNEEHLIKQFDLLPMIDRSVESQINPSHSNWKFNYYSLLFDIDPDYNRKKQICENYLQGLEWCFFYYNKGCIDWKWKYKYNYPPLIQDLLLFVPINKTTFIESKPIQAIHPLSQLSYVLPIAGFKLLPINLSQHLLNNHKEWFQETNDFSWAFCKYFWESHVIFPEVDIDEIESIVNTI